MAGVSTRRCDACHEVVLVSDRGRLRTVEGTRYVEARPNGDVVFRCTCGAVILWKRQLAKVASDV